MFLRCGDYLKFLRGLGKFRQKDVPSYTFFSLWRLTWIFEGTWKNFHKKSVPSHMFLRCGDYLKFLMGLGKFRQKDVTSYTFFSQCRLTWIFEGTWKKFHKMCAQSYVSSLWRLSQVFEGLGKFRQKDVPSYTFFSLWRLTWIFEGTWKNFHKKSVPSHMFLRCGDYLKFLMGLGKFRKKRVTSYTFYSQCRLS